ncbi:MAG: hypothetical protein KDD37_10465 [Bdellovibrionales bacterium]|nr:hypothetical protein [Bdellovibrionales bacterium]
MLLVLAGTALFVKENWFSSEKKVYTFVPSSYQETLATNETSDWESDPSEEVNQESSNDVRQPASKAVAEERAPQLEVLVASIPTSSLAYIVGKEILPEDLRKFQSYRLRKAIDAKDLASLEDTTILYTLNYVILAQQDPLVIQQYVFDAAAQDELGFKLMTAVDSYRNDQLIFDVALTQNFYVGKTVHREDQALRLQIGEQQSRILTGILPRKPLSEREKILLQGGYLGLMNAPEFQSGENSFIIVLTYKY